MSIGRVAHQLSFALSPIILTGGLAGLIPGGMLPLMALTQALNFVGGLLEGAVDLTPDNAFATFEPMTGSSLIDNQYGTYPFANQQVAANAVIQQPLNISMKMIVPAQPEAGGFPAKLAIMTALQAALKSHTNQGGSYTVVTPAALYTNCLLLSLKDVGTGQPSQPQALYQWDFFAPLLTEEQALTAMNVMMGKIDAGLPSTGALSGAAVTNFPQSLVGSSVSPSMSSLQGASVAGFQNFGGGGFF